MLFLHRNLLLSRHRWICGYCSLNEKCSIFCFVFLMLNIQAQTWFTTYLLQNLFQRQNCSFLLLWQLITAISTLSQTWRNADPPGPTHELSDPPGSLPALSPCSSTNIPLTRAKWLYAFSLSCPLQPCFSSSVGSHRRSSHGISTWVRQDLLEQLRAEFREALSHCQWCDMNSAHLMLLSTRNISWAMTNHETASRITGKSP